MNPIQQAIEALKLAHDVSYSEANNEKFKAALTSLRSLQKEVEGVGLPPLPVPDERTRKGLAFSGFAMEAYARTAVAAALGRGAVPPRWKLVPTRLPFDTEMRPVLARFCRAVEQGQAIMFDDFWDELLAAAPTPEATQPDYGIGELAHASERFEQAQTIFEATQPTQAESPDEPYGGRLEDKPYAGFMRQFSGGRPTQAEAPAKCAQCKKEYRHGKAAVGCPKCAPGVKVTEAEFQKPIDPPAQAEAPSEREAFEAKFTPATWEGECAKLDMPVPINKIGHYYLRDDELRWEAWKARAALATQQAVQGEAVAWMHSKTGQIESAAAFAQPYNWGPRSEWEPLYAATPPAPGQVERDREDAENYRWLLSRTRFQHGIAWLGSFSTKQTDCDFFSLEEARQTLDTAIRAARSSEGGGNG